MKGTFGNYFVKCVLLIVIPLLAFGFYPNSEKILKVNNTLYLSNTVVIKLKNKPVAGSINKILLSDKLNLALKEFNVNSSKSFLPSNNSGTELDKIIVVKYDSNQDPHFVAKQLSSISEVEWAEPKFVYPVVDFTPNDPSYSSQSYLPLIKAPAAWAITPGDTSVIIGIVDTGVDWSHPDLAGNIWRNWGETPNNGVDDDHNGYIDDVRGWDFGGLGNADGTPTPDNDPMEDRPDHGTHVAGLASAVTNNAIGIASIGFKSKIMPVKTSEDNYRAPDGGAYIIFGFEGIVYAADNHARVINCSWGGAGFSLLGQETINYALSKGAVVVCAAGNDASAEEFYPADYNGVLSVAATTSTDVLASFSNYGKGISVCAPGNNLYSTWQPDTYRLNSGTSMASPLVAGLAALVTAKFPQYTAEQVREQVRVNCDDITSANPHIVNLLGKGRINALKSLSNVSSESVRATQVTFSDEAPGGNNNGIFEPGETITVSIAFENYLLPTTSLSVSMESKNSSSTVTNGNLSAGSIGTLQSFNNYSAKFTFKLSNSMPSNVPLDFLLHFTDGSYSDIQWISALGNPSYATQTGNDISLTITSIGNLGHNDYPSNFQGTGFHFGTGPNYMFEGALMIATSPTKVVDVARDSTGSQEKTGFRISQPIKIITPGTVSDYEGTTVFNDSSSTERLGLNVKLRSYSFIDPADKNYIILRYTINNISGATLSNLYTGLLIDWDMVESTGANDLTAYDNTGNFGYVHHQGLIPDTTIGIGLLSANNYNFYAIDNSVFGYTDHEKWAALSSGLTNTSAGPADIANVTASGPYSIPAGGTIDVAFALAADVSVQNLRSEFANARSKYNLILTSVQDNINPVPYTFELSQNYPNPFNPSTTIRYSIPSKSQVILRIYDMLGREVRTLLNEAKEAGNYSINFYAGNLPSGVYLYKLSAGNFTSTKKLVLIK
ncbi:MAG: S8 family serine peptidase [Ignavibacteriaceae bacterium]|nr:S8 family serine peptidase [Ignavibacteriaceae bacterium]